MKMLVVGKCMKGCHTDTDKSEYLLAVQHHPGLDGARLLEVCCV